MKDLDQFTPEDFEKLSNTDKSHLARIWDCASCTRPGKCMFKDRYQRLPKNCYREALGQCLNLFNFPDTVTIFSHETKRYYTLRAYKVDGGCQVMIHADSASGGHTWPYKRADNNIVPDAQEVKKRLRRYGRELLVNNDGSLEVKFTWPR